MLHPRHTISDYLPIEDANLRGYEYADFQSKALTSIALSLARAGDQNRARQLAAKAEACARGHINPHHRNEVLGLIAMATAQTGDYARAKHITKAISNSSRRALLLAQIAEMATEKTTTAPAS